MQLQIHTDYQSHADFIAQLPHTFDSTGTIVYSGRNVVKSFCVNGEEWIVKHYKKPNFAQRLAYTFWRQSKALRAFLYANRLLSLGIDTPLGIACIECSQNGLFSDGYFISTLCPHQPLYPLLVPNETIDEPTVAALAAFFVEMHQKGFLHGDPNLNNILYHTDAQHRLRFSVIDTNRSVFIDAPTRKQCLENLKRVTHRRDLLQCITRHYARLRGWEEDSCVDSVIHSLDKFEQHTRIKKQFKAKLHG